MAEIQLEGTIQFGPSGGALVDYSDVITSLVINKGRNTVTRPATFANAQEDQRAGSHTETVTINFISDMAAAGFWAELWDAINTDSAELDFSALLEDAVVGVNNPRFEGTVIVTDLDTGGEVGSLRVQSKTYPVKAGTLTKATS